MVGSSLEFFFFLQLSRRFRWFVYLKIRRFLKQGTTFKIVPLLNYYTLPTYLIRQKQLLTLGEPQHISYTLYSTPKN